MTSRKDFSEGSRIYGSSTTVERRCPCEMGQERCKRRLVFHHNGYTRSQIQVCGGKRRREKLAMGTGHLDQCFYITNPSKPTRVVVRRGKRNIIRMEGVANEQDFDKYGDPKME